MRSGLLFCQGGNIVGNVKRISTIRILLLAGVLLFTIPSAFAQITYSQSFTGGSSSPAQCTAWNTYRASLPSSGITSFTLKGSNDPVGVTCTNATIAQNIADALRLGTTYSGTSDGHTWLASSACCGAELTSTGTFGNCTNPGYTIRPCIGNVNWGGINGLTCGAPSQTITVVFSTAAVGPTFDNGSPQSLTVCNNSGANPINSLLTASEATGSTLTWTVTSGPSHGSLSGFPATASSGTSVSPTGTSYTPTAGYNGTDAFTIQASDGTNTATTTINVSVNPLPITGTASVCVGATTTLSDATTGGTWSSSSTGYATVGSASGIVTGVSAGTVNISYTDGGGCITSTPVTVNATPNPITGVFGTCVGSTTNLVESMGGGTWSSSNTAVATVGSSTGTVTGVSAGSATITYAFSTGCQVVRNVTVETNPASAAYTVTPNPVCQNSSTTFSSGATPCSVNMLLFNGNNSQASLGAPISTATDNITMEAWISWSGTTANNQFIMLNGNSGSSGYGLYLPAGSNQLAIVLGGVATLSSTATVPIGPWTHVAAVRNSGTWSVYVNGVQSTVTSATSTPNVPATNFMVGSSQAANEAFNGPIDDAKFWSMARTTTDIQNDMNACNTFPQTNLLGYWRFDEVSGTTAADASGNGNTLTESNIAHGGSVNLNISTYAWNFGDGGTSATNNVAHTYTTSGNFSSSFTLTNSNGCSLSSGTVVTVNPLPSAISGTPTVCVGSTTTLGNTLSGGTWSSATPAVATVGSSSGVVTGVAPGTSVITYTSAAGCSKTITVTVNANPAAIGGTTNVCVGLTTTLTDGSTPGTWTSDNTAIATIGSASGTVTGVASGTTFITYTMTATGCYATQAFTVNPNPASISGSLGICQGSTSTLADATSGGTWSSSNSNVTIGSSSGIATGVTVGNATITYTLPTGCINTAAATVNANPTAITGTTTVCTGFTTTLSSTPGTGTWSSSDVTIATVGSSSGIVTGAGAGIATITYTLPTGCTVTTSYTVNQTPVATTGTPVVCVGQTTTLSDATAGGTWSSSNTGQATVGSASGIITGVAAGTPNIVYTMPTGCSVTTPITVNALPAAIGGANNVCVGSTTTLTDASTPGTWSSSNSTLGSIGSSSGTVTGVSAGNITITYTLNATGCYITQPFTVNTTPAAITGSSTVCTGSTITLADATTGGTWSSSNANATVGSSSGIVTGVTAGTANITYTLPAGSCTAITTITINQTPAAIAGASGVCVGLTTNLTDGTAGGTWSSTNSAIGSIGTSGTVTGVSAGTITISYIMPTGCYAALPFTVNPTPAAITGTLVVCQSSTTSLSDATGGGTWSSSNTGQATVGSTSGIVTGVAAGNPNIIYTLPAGCTATATLTVNPAPNVSSFSSPTSTSPCQGAAATVTVNSSSLGVGTFTVTYNLSGANSATGNTATLSMTGSSGTFSIPASALPNTGSTTVTITQITNSFGCTSAVSTSNTASFSVNILPTAYTVSGGGGYCSGGSGVHVFLSNSTGGVNYQLYLGGSPVGIPVAGTFSALDMGAQTAAGTYTIVATNTTTLCSATMTGSVTVTVNPLPTAYAVTGGGSYCSGGSGLPVGLANSQIGTNYQLYVGGSATGSAVAGTGAAISFGNQTTAGTYTVVATTTSTSCTNNMTGSVTIIVNPLPATITGTLSVCQGLTTTLSSTTSGGTWTSVNTAVATVGSGSGVVTGVAAGTSVISYTLSSTGCATSATVTVNSLPAAIAGAGTVCSGATLSLADATGGGTWTSSNTGEATVGSTSGVVTGVAAGTPTITYTLPTGCIATTGITVNNTPAAVTGISTVCVGATTSLSDITGGGSWSSSNTTFATVGSGTGVVSGVAVGSVNISYTISGCSAIFPMTVNPAPASIAGVTNVCAGSTTTLTDATPSGTWTSSNTSLATVSGSGVVTGVAAGTLTITYTLSTGCFATTPFTVNTTPAAITGTSVICVGASATLNDVTGGGSWSSSNTALASVGSGTGIVTGVAAGNPTITYTLPAGNCTAVFPMTINANPAAIAGSSQVCVGLTTTLSDATTGGSWTSSNSAIASISGSGLVTGNTAGTVTMTYTLGTGCFAVFPMTVNANPAAITGPTTVCTGFTITLADATTGGSWSSSNTSMATVVSGTGVVTGVSAGNPTITYTLPTGCIATTPITVNTTPVAILGTNTLCTGSTTTLSDATSGGTWSSSDLTKATVGSASGVVTAVAAGNPVISYTSTLGCSATFPMTINLQPAAITGVPTVCTGATTALSDVTPSGTWSSSNPAAGSVSTGGVVSGITAGTTTISYTLSGGCFSVLPMTVNQTPAAITGASAVCVGGTTTLADASTGGTWSASNAFATVGSSTGVVTGVTAGNLNITYTLPGGCNAVKAMTVNSLPASITGTPVVCVSATTTLSDATAGGTWSSSNTLIATIGTSGVMTGVSAGTVTLSYTLGTGCFATIAGTVNALPVAYTVTGGGAYCSGGAGAHIGLSNSAFGFSYQLVLNGTTNIGSPIPGTNAPLDFGAQTAAGTYTVIGINNTTGCTQTMSSSALITINPLPTVFNVTGGGSYCAGGTGIAIGLNGSSTGVSYQLYLGTAPSGSAVAGTNSAISFGLKTIPGTYTVIATNTVTACTSSMTGAASITVNPLPNVYTVTGGGAYCTGGTGVVVGISNSDVGVNYQLMNGGSNVGSPVAGTNAPLSFGLQTLTGSYTVQATNASTGCSVTYTSSVTVTINPLPVNTYSVTGTGSYCSGGAGLPIGLSNSQAGINYQLYFGALPVGSAVAGTGTGAISFGLQVAGGTYTVVGTSATTGCTATMTGSAVITVNPLPAVYSFTGGGQYCTGGTGVSYTLSGSVTGVNYLLYNGTTLVSTLPGTGSVLTGTLTTAGTYTVVAQDANGCTRNMTGSDLVIVNPLPTAFTVSGTGSYCAGGAGIHVLLSSSSIGVNYQLMLGGAPMGLSVAGTGASLDFGAQTAAGTYTVVATNPTTTCTSTMTGSATITINPLPAINNVTGGGSYCAGGTGVAIGLNGSVSGISYQLINSGGPVGSPVTGTGSAFSFPPVTAAGTYSVTATNTATSCTSTMARSATISINPLPTTFLVTGGGSYCSGGTGVAVGLANSATGVNYQLYNGTTAYGASLAGTTGSALSFGVQTTPGVYTVKATDAIFGCSATMTGSATVTVNALPATYNVTGGGAYCAGGTGVAVGLSNSSTGVNYQLKLGGVALGAPLAGTGSALNFGLQTAAGIYTITATDATTGCTNNMTGSAAVSINTLPAVFTVTGGGNYCIGGTGVVVGLTGSALGVSYQLYNGSTPVGAPVAGVLGAISFGLQTAAGTYTVVATNTTSGCTSNMTGSAVVVINPLPAAYSVTGGGSYCSGGTGVHVGLSNSDIGTTYQLYIGTLATGTPVAGTGTTLDFGLQTVAGTYTVVANNTTTTCTNNMAGSASVSINTLPTAYTVTGGGSYCAGGTGMSVGLNGSDAGVNYQLYRDGSAVGLPVIGSGSSLDFGLQATAGAYTVVATTSSTACTNNMTGSAVITVNPLPTAYSVTGGGSYCTGGAGLNVGLSASDAGISYQLYKGTTTVGSPIGGTGLALDFGVQTAPGIYSVVATDPVATCTNNMDSPVTIVVNPLPTVFNVTGGGSYCAGGAGYHVGLSGSSFGVDYQLYNGGTAVGMPVHGTGFALDFGMISVAGNYTVVATASGSLCTANMAGSATISVNALPTVYAVTGGGSYCPGGTGMAVGLNGSDTGVNYKLYRGTTLVATMPGNDSTISFGLQTTAGAYTIVGMNAASGCTSNMTGSAVIAISPLPTVYTVTGGGSYCAGGYGVHVSLSSSDAGVNYQLYRGGTPVGTPVAGTGILLDLGIQSFTGSYTVVGTNATTGCTNNMAGSAIVAISPVPAVYSLTGGGSYCAGSAAPHIMTSGSATGVNYQLYRGGSAVGTAIAGTGASIDFGAETAGTYTVIATDHFTGCTSTMTDTVNVAVNALPLTYSVIGGGNYCAGGAGLSVGLTSSQSGVNYQLYKDGAIAGSPIAGTTAAISFGLQIAPGTYTVMATNTTTGCTSYMTGSAIISVNANPTVYTETGGGSYCAGGTGRAIGLSSSQSGVNYQLRNGGTTVGSALPGTGAAISFGLQTAAGAYTVLATNTATGCTSVMADSLDIIVNPLPVAYSVTGGGSYCSGTSGVAVGLNTSDNGISYQLYYGSTAMGSPVAGVASSAITFGLQTLAGTYTVAATNTATGCTANMSGSATVSITPTVVPAVTINTGVGDTVCAGSNVTFTAVSTNAGSSPVYQWSVNNRVVAATSGSYTYSPLNGDTVSVQLTSNATCAIPATANGSVKMAVLSNQTPTVTIYAAPGDSLCGATAVTLTLNSTWGGSAPSYRWYLNGAPTAAGPVYNLTPNNGDVIFAVLSSSYKCVTDTGVISNNIKFSVDHADTPVVMISGFHEAVVDSYQAVIVNDPYHTYTYTYQWYINGNLQTLVTGSYMLLAPGSVPTGSQITCVVYRRNYCGIIPGAATYDVISNVGVHQMSLTTGDIRLVPNPNKGIFTLKGSLGTQVDEQLEIEITDMLGQVLFRNSVIAKNGLLDEHINISNSVANGMYLLNLRSAAGNQVFHMVVEQ